MVIENTCIYNVIENNNIELIYQINPLHFIDPVNSEIWKNILLCFKDTKKCNTDDIKNYVSIQGYQDLKLKQIISKIESIKSNYCPLPENAKDKMYKHFCIQKQKELVKILNNEHLTHSIKNNKILEINKQISENNLNNTLTSLQDSIDLYITEMNDNKQTRLNERSISCDINWVKSIFQNYIRPCPIIIGAAPGYHKTTCAINLLWYFNFKKLNGMYFSWEDNIDVLRNKYIAIKKDISKQAIDDGELTEYQKEQIKSLYKKENRIWVTDQPYNILQFRREIDRQMSLKDYRFIIIDYIEMFLYNYKDEPKELKKIMNEIVRICNQYMIPVIILSQINYENKDTIEPKLRDLFGSSGLEKSARQVIMLGGERSSNVRQVYMRKNSYGGLNKTEIEINQESGRIL
jgi:replicative DNA helicase